MRHLWSVSAKLPLFSNSHTPIIRFWHNSKLFVPGCSYVVERPVRCGCTIVCAGLVLRSLSLLHCFRSWSNASWAGDFARQVTLLYLRICHVAKQLALASSEVPGYAPAGSLLIRSSRWLWHMPGLDLRPCTIFRTLR